MKRSLMMRAAALSGAMVLGACTAPTEVSRATIFQTIGEERALTGVAREFIRETPYVVHFEFDKAVLTNTAKTALNTQADWIKAHPGVLFSVYGHTDQVGTDDYNMELGRARATAVINYLVSRGVDMAQLELVLSLGEQVPIIDVEAPAEINRRATTYVAGLVQKRVATRPDRERKVEKKKRPERPEKPEYPEEPEQPDLPLPEQPDEPLPEQPDEPLPEQPDLPLPDKPKKERPGEKNPGEPEWWNKGKPESEWKKPDPDRGKKEQGEAPSA